MIARIVFAALCVLLGGSSAAFAAYTCFTIPNSASAAFAAQARVFSQDFQILADAARGNGVVFAASDCLVTQRAAGANLSVDVAACTVVSEGATASVASGNVVVSAADGTNPRIDIVSATNAGVKTITAGTPASSPLPPTIPQSGGVNNIVLAFVYVPAGDNSIQNNQITDKRMCVNTPGSGSGAGTGLSYITKVAEGTLSNEFAMGSLATGLVQNTVTTGVPTTIAPTDDNVVVGNGTTWQLKALPTCSGGTDALAYNVSTNTFTCNTIATAGTGLSYWTRVAEAGLSAETAMGALGTGLIINTTTTGIPTIYAGQTCTNQFVSATSASGALTCTTPTLTGAQYANQGTATTVLHGNAAGNPSFGAVSLTADVTGDLPYANLTPATAASRMLCRGSAGGAGDWQECDLAAGLTLSGTTLTPGFTASSSDTLTNKLLDAEGTGNTVKIPSKIWLPAAGCDNATAGTVYDQPTSNGGTAACYGTSPMRFGALNYADGANALTSQVALHLPSDWDSAQAVDVKFLWFSGSTSTSSVVWTLATSCLADTEDLLAPTFNAAQTVADANLATANQRNSASIAGVTMTGCAAGELLFLRVGRDPTSGSDNLAATAALIGIEVTFRRSM